MDDDDDDESVMNACTTRGQCSNPQLVMVTELSFSCSLIGTFILVRVAADLEPILGARGKNIPWMGHPPPCTHTCTLIHFKARNPPTGMLLRVGGCRCKQSMQNTVTRDQDWIRDLVLWDGNACCATMLVLNHHDQTMNCPNRLLMHVCARVAVLSPVAT